MIFSSDFYYVELVNYEDLKGIEAVYNSNIDFLQSHLGMENVTTDWLVDELESMRLIGFNTFKIVEIQTNKIIGTIDMKIESEVTYLSLLILHQDYINKGYGTNIYKELEKYIKSLKSKSIRIDVVTKNNVNVLEFWVRNGFTKDKEIELNWSGMILPAVSMTKKLYII